MATPSIAANGISYSGRLTEPNGKPLEGPLDLTIRFYSQASDGSPILGDLHKSQVTLQDGVFQVELDLSSSDLTALLGNGTNPLYIEISQGSTTYPRQRFTAVPFALRVPVDGTTIQYNSAGELTATVSSIKGKPVDPTVDNPSANTYLKYDGTKWVAEAIVGGAGGTVTSLSATSPLSVTNPTSTPQISIPAATGSVNGYLTSGDWTTFNNKQNSLNAASSVSNGYLTSADFLIFNNKQASITASSTVNAGTLTTANAIGLEVKPSGGAASAIRLDDNGGTNYVALKAPAAVGTNYTLTLPTDDGSNGQYLTTDGTGNLSWTAPGSVTSFTGSLSGDVTGTQGSTTVATVGGSSAANVHAAELLANAATNANTASTIVKRDSSGNFSAGTITANLSGNATTATSSTSFSGSLSGDVTGNQSSTVVASVGGSTASNVNAATIAANAATNANTASTIVKRDSSGNFSAGTITANLSGNATNVTGTVAIANGGTGQTTANAALNALLPSQGSQSGKVLTTNGTDTSWLSLSTTNWDTAYSDRLKWDGGSTGLVAATGRTSLGLGTAATLNVGTAANNVVQLDSNAKLPAIDGSQLTGVVATVVVGSGGGAASTPTSGCPTGYILVPGDTDYGTSDFCVMKYEAKFGDKGAESRAAGLPARGNISQTVAQASCRNLGPGYALINNSEWMTVAANVANVASNWSSAAVGSTALNRGHSDNSPANALAAVTDDNDPCNGTGQTCSSTTWNDQRRTHKLSNNNVIWDFAGNVWEWVDFVNYEDKPSAAAAWAEYTAVSSSTTMNKTSLVPSNAQKAWWVNTWNGATNGIGQYYAGTNSSGGALLRGGTWLHGTRTGVFTAALDFDPSLTNTNIGFRCVFRPASP